jgi:hypothetical protein
MHSITSEDLLLYLYGETTKLQTEAIELALQQDWSLMEKLELLTQSRNELETISFSPSTNSINNILKYAEKSVEEISTVS